MLILEKAIGVSPPSELLIILPNFIKNFLFTNFIYKDIE
jgi:hypothetical protein